MKTIQLGEDLAVPVDIATQTLLVVGKRGTGKSNTCVRLAEQLHAASVPFVVLDPADSWWGLKASRDGRGPGLAVYVFGGRHPDLPLEATGGAIVADVLIDRRVSAIVSLRQFSSAQRATFVAAFCERLLERNSEPLHVFLEEAHELAPQVPDGGEERMLGAVKKLWTRGRSSGLSGSAITQRPASLHKTITTQSEILCVHRLVGPQDVAAVREWIRYHHGGEEILGQLPKLKTGEAFVWAPDFPEAKPLGLIRAKILRRETFDSAATPKVGERRVEPRALAPVDVEQLGAAMAATVERAKAEDPKHLHARIRELEALVKKAEGRAPVIERVEVQVPVIDDALRVRLGDYAGRCEQFGKELYEAARDLREALDRAARTPPPGLVRAPAPRAAQAAAVPRPVAPRQPRSQANGEGLGRAERAILSVLANRQGKSTTRSQAGVMSGYSTKSSHLDNTISKLRTAGYVVGGRDELEISHDGFDALGPFEPLPTGAALVDYWVRETGKAPGAMLRVLVDAYPRTMTREDVASATGYSADSSHLDNSLSYLRTLELITGGKGALRASEDLFG